MELNSFSLMFQTYDAPLIRMLVTISTTTDSKNTMEYWIHSKTKQYNLRICACGIRRN